MSLILGLQVYFLCFVNVSVIGKHIFQFGNAFGNKISIKVLLLTID
ncbi:hypothetical protein SAMN06265367_1155 [Algoriphagus winogradskyi]|uniref:Uncharacterized protein n=1 Tax=Algoriphagus winogradskyi TaxID=237017 RepID=A0ABY1PL56_9BACT|nr:hypothetical protein SAMN06265367_1155 [Algoriphagus winogradskyi]